MNPFRQPSENEEDFAEQVRLDGEAYSATSDTDASDSEIRIVSNTLKPVIERWSDPGDYPSGAGGGPLASYNYVEQIEGDIIIETTDEWLAGLSDSPGDIEHGVSGLVVKSWEIRSVTDNLPGCRVVLTVDGFEMEPPEPEYPDFEPEDYDHDDFEGADDWRG